MATDNTSKNYRIIVGVDGSESSVVALRWALRQARLTNGIIDAIIAWQIPASVVGYGVTPISADTLNYREKHAKQVLAEAISKATSPHDIHRVYSVVTQAVPGQALTEASGDADLLVVGSRGLGEVSGTLHGSVSQYCVHHARCPVVVIRGTTPHEGSLSGSAVKRPARHGKKVLGGWAPLTRAECAECVEIATKAVQEAISTVTGPSGNPRVHPVVEQGRPARLLLDASAEADLLVVGSRGHGVFADMLLGSISKRCFQHAKCPVVVMRGEPATAKAA